MPYRFWVRISVFNLLLVAIAGAVMRYKIAFSLPWVDQKHLLHGHSHFAFSGWVSAALYTIIVWMIFPNGPASNYRRMFLFLLVASYGMLLTFPFMGYAGPSIFFSALTVVFSYILMFMVWKPVKQLGSAALWIRTALVCNAVSSFGTFALAYMMKKPGMVQEFYIGSVYFFLHFQYNGWFFFACTGIFLHWLSSTGVVYNERSMRWSWLLFTIAVVPGFFLSALWMRLPFGLYLVALVAALFQVPAAVMFLRSFKLSDLQLTKPVKLAWGLALFAILVKVLLQLLSCIPSLSIFAFGYRPLVIAYLHLVLLGFVSLFILGFYMQRQWIHPGKAFYVFVIGVVLNEVLLIIQGLGAIGYIALPYTNHVLFCVSLVMVGGLLGMQEKGNSLPDPASS